MVSVDQIHSDPTKSNPTKLNPGNTNCRGRFRTIEPLIKKACFVRNVNYNFSIKVLVQTSEYKEDLDEPSSSVRVLFLPYLTLLKLAKPFESTIKINFN
jgi:hypothetical protein